MINATKKTLAYTLLSVACFTVAPIAASAQENPAFPTTYIDVFQDGTLFITYEEYLERQRRVEAAQATGRVVVAPRATPRTPITAQVARDTNTMALRDQWQIGAFR